MLFKHNQMKVSWVGTLAIILFGLVILGISLAQASWSTLNKDINMDRFRINPVEIEIENSQDGGIKKILYNLPQINNIPSGFIYEIKKWRDGIWINLSSRGDKRERANLYMLLADKRIAEMLVVSQLDNYEKEELYKFGQEAITFLERTVKTTNEMDNLIEVSKIISQVGTAKIFYQQVFRSIGEVVGEESNYANLEERLLKILK